MPDQTPQSTTAPSGSDPASRKAGIRNLAQSGRLQEARTQCEQLCSAFPGDAEAWFLHGYILNSLGHFPEAESSYRNALQLAPGNANIHFNLGCTLDQAGRRPQAIEAYQTAVGLKPDFAEALNSLGVALVRNGNALEGIRRLREAVHIRPEYREARLNLSRSIDQSVPRWHFPMLNDESRNGIYDQAIRAAVGEDTTVLDIGTGSGLLSMMAARAGARHIYTCEAETVIAEKAREIIDRNGFADRITVFPHMSTHLKVGVDIPERADVLVSEIVDTGLLGEGVVSSVQHARDHLLKVDARIIPCRATVYGVLLESEALHQQNHVSTASGFDVSPFNEFSSAIYQQTRLSHFPHQYLCEPFEVFTFDFTGAPIRPETRSITIKTTRAGTCHATALWFRLQLDEHNHIDTDPLDPGCWMQAVQTIQPAPQVTAGQSVRLTAEHDCMVIGLSDISPQ